MPILDYPVQNDSSTGLFSGMPGSIVFLVALVLAASSSTTADRTLRLVVASFSRIAIDEVFHQQWNVLSSLSKRRYLDREDIQPIKQITTKGPSADGGLQVTIGGSDHPNVSALESKIRSLKIDKNRFGTSPET
jgi:hypothetical protein